MVKNNKCTSSGEKLKYRLKCIAETKLNLNAQRSKIKKKTQKIKDNTRLKSNPWVVIKLSKNNYQNEAKIVIHIIYHEHL